MAVHGIAQEGKGRGSSTAGDWSVKTNIGKPVLHPKDRKPLAGLSFASAAEAARAHFSRTGEWVHLVRG